MGDVLYIGSAVLAGVATVVVPYLLVLRWDRRRTARAIAGFEEAH